VLFNLDEKQNYSDMLVLHFLNTLPRTNICFDCSNILYLLTRDLSEESFHVQKQTENFSVSSGLCLDAVFVRVLCVVCACEVDVGFFSVFGWVDVCTCI